MCSRDISRTPRIFPAATHGASSLYGGEGIEDMRAVKRAIDPEWKLAPGVLFPRT